jgi:branched-subunit amino acid transport protein AzlD
MLILYCVKAVAPFAWPHGLPEAISVGAVAVIQWWKRNTLLSIVSGTALYMLLVQMVFTQA